jgi:hypothetical protein
MSIAILLALRAVWIRLGRIRMAHDFLLVPDDEAAVGLPGSLEVEFVDETFDFKPKHLNPLPMHSNGFVLMIRLAAAVSKGRALTGCDFAFKFLNFDRFRDQVPNDSGPRVWLLGQDLDEHGVSTSSG